MGSVWKLIIGLGYTELYTGFIWFYVEFNTITYAQEVDIMWGSYGFYMRCFIGGLYGSLYHMVVLYQSLYESL